MSEVRDGEMPNGSPMDAPEDYVPWMERLTPAQRRKFRAEMRKLRREFEAMIRDAKRFERTSRKARIEVNG